LYEKRCNRPPTYHYLPQIIAEILSGITVAPQSYSQRRNEMETVTIFHDRFSSRLEKINWPFITFWLAYFTAILGFGYAML
jgi:hypothetical protein